MSKSSYVHMRRSETTRQRPILDLDPVDVSLTEGTDIPPPPKELDITPEVSEVPEVPNLPRLRAPTKEERLGEKPRSASRHSGPLSSHPVTPIDASDGEPGHSGNPFESQAAYFANRTTRPSTTSSAPLASTPQSKAPAGGDAPSAGNRYYDSSSSSQHSGTMNPPPPKGFPGGEEPPSYQESPSSRRPSFASRFLRFRSFSSLRSRNASSATLTDDPRSQMHSAMSSKRPSTDALNATGPRGQKRPGSPSIFASSSLGPLGAAQNGDNRGIHSFPRMVRKKSMDLMSSARRRSGMWGRTPDEERAMEEEAALERSREMAEQDQYDGRPASRMDTTTSNGNQSSMREKTDTTDSDMSDVQRTLSRKTESVHSPTPQLPEMDESFGSDLQGESMFDGIGRD